MHIEPYLDISCNPCIYNHGIFRTLAHLENEGYSKACRTCKMTKHFQRTDIARIVYSSIFKDIEGYWCIFSHTHRRTPRGGGKPPLPFLENQMSCSDRFRTLCNSCIFRTLLYSELCNACIFRTLPYSEFWHSCGFAHIYWRTLFI